MSKDSLESIDSIIRYAKDEEAHSEKFRVDSIVVDGDQLALKTDDEVFRLYRACKFTTAVRIILYYELVRRGRAAGILLTKYFSDHGLKHDTEYRFVKRETEALNAELLPAPQPVPELGIPEAGDAEATTRESVEVEPTTTNPVETPKVEKKPCHMCGVRKARIEKMEEEILDLKQTKHNLKATNKSLQESLDALLKERKEVKKAAIKKRDAADIIPRYRKDKMATGEFAVMRFVGTHDREAWESIEINKDETAIDARLIELNQKAAIKAKSATAYP